MVSFVREACDDFKQECFLVFAFFFYRFQTDIIQIITSPPPQNIFKCGRRRPGRRSSPSPFTHTGIIATLSATFLRQRSAFPPVSALNCFLCGRSTLIFMALMNSKTGSLPVSEIYSFMTEHFPYFKVPRRAALPSHRSDQAAFGFGPSQ